MVSENAESTVQLLRCRRRSRSGARVGLAAAEQKMAYQPLSPVSGTPVNRKSCVFASSESRRRAGVFRVAGAVWRLSEGYARVSRGPVATSGRRHMSACSSTVARKSTWAARLTSTDPSLATGRRAAMSAASSSPHPSMILMPHSCSYVPVKGMDGWCRGGQLSWRPRCRGRQVAVHQRRVGHEVSSGVCCCGPGTSCPVARRRARLLVQAAPPRCGGKRQATAILADFGWGRSTRQAPNSWSESSARAGIIP